MNILIHRSIINELLQSNGQTEYLLREHEALDVTFYVPDVWLKELSERIKQIEDQIPPFIRELLLHTDLYINVISSPDYQITLRQAEEISRKPEDIPYFAVILYVRTIDRVWSNNPLQVSQFAEDLPFTVYNTTHLKTAVRKWRIFATRVTSAQPGIESTTKKEAEPTGTTSKKESEPTKTPSEKESEPSTEENTYSNYGKKSDFHWMTDNRLDPMLYHRFLHFYGLRCLNDDKIYYLDPDPAEKKLSLPKIEKLEPSTPIWIIRRIYLEYEDYYQFKVYTVDIEKWDFYWQLFLHLNGKKFEGGSDILEKENIGTSKFFDIRITEKEHVALLPPDTEHRLPDYQQGIDLFTTNTDLIDTHPDNWENMSKERAEKKLGVDIIKLGKEGVGLRIENKVLGTAVIDALSLDYDQDDFVEEDKDKLKNEYDFSFEKEDSDAD